MNDLVSVVIPTYNRGDLLVETINSVIKQTYKNIEIIVVDDGSTDNTEEIVSRLGYRQVRFFKIPHYGFPAPVRNYGIREARGSYIALLDSDDLWKTRKLELQMKEFEADPELILVSSDMEYIGEESTRILNLKRNKRMYFHDLLRRNLILNSTVIFRKDVTQTIGFIDENPDLKSVEDYDYWLRILKQFDGKSLILDKIYAQYRVHENNISGVTRPLSLLIEFRKLLVIFKKYINQNDLVVRRIVDLRLENARLNLYFLRLKARTISFTEFLNYGKITPVSKLKGFFFYVFDRISIKIKMLNKIVSKRIYI